MDTPPQTPPAYDHSLGSDYAIHYWDFAYEHKGPFRLHAADIREEGASSIANLLSGPTIDFLVGQPGRKWTIHRKLLSYHSSWFEMQLASQLKTESSTINLPDVAPQVFELFVCWLYQGKIDNVSQLAIDRKWEYAYQCEQLYVFAETLEMPELKNAAIDVFRRGCFEAGLVPGPEEMIPIYEKTPPSSCFRELIAQIAARQIMDPDSYSDAGFYRDCFSASPDFAIDVVNAVKQNVGGQLLKDPTEELHTFSESQVHNPLKGQPDVRQSKL